MAEEYSAAWCNRDAGAVASFFAPEGSRTINGGRPAKGREAIAASAQELMTGFPDLEVTLDNLVDRGDRFVYSWTLNGTNSGPGGMGYPLKISGTDMWRLNSDGDIVESQGRFDQADYDRQVKLGQTR
jgi:predicted ester cyclase